MATKDAEVDVKEITVWALRIFVTDSKCRKVRYSNSFIQRIVINVNSNCLSCISQRLDELWMQEWNKYQNLGT